MTQVINTGRGSGKTMMLLKQASINNGLYVCLDAPRKAYAKDLCKKFNIEEPKMTTYSQLHYDSIGLSEDVKLYLDDITSYMGRLGHRQVEMITI